MTCLTFALFDMEHAWPRHNPTMTDYRPNRVPGGTYFFTVRLLDRRSTLLTDHISAFGEAIRQARTKKPFHVDAWVVLPDHAHAIWTLPPGDVDCAGRWRAVKIAFSKAMRKSNTANANDGAIWERHYQDRAIADDTQYTALVDYLHGDPIRHGFCERAADWPWSSLHRFVAAGFIAAGERAGAHNAEKGPKALSHVS